MYSVKEQLMGFPISSAAFGRLRLLDGELKNLLRGCQLELRQEQVKNFAQENITHHFKRC